MFVLPTPENFHAFAWKTLDVTLFAWYMVNRRRRKLKLHPNVSPDFLEKDNPMVHRGAEYQDTLFPLVTSLAIDMGI